MAENQNPRECIAQIVYELIASIDFQEYADKVDLKVRENNFLSNFTAVDAVSREKKYAPRRRKLVIKQVIKSVRNAKQFLSKMHRGLVSRTRKINDASYQHSTGIIFLLLQFIRHDKSKVISEFGKTNADFFEYESLKFIQSNYISF